MSLSSSLLVAILLSAVAPGIRHEADNDSRKVQVDYDNRCTEGEPEETGTAVLRPTQVAYCSYSRSELIERFARIIELDDGRLELEEIEAAFGVPRLQTSFDDSRAAWFTVYLRGRGDNGGWKAAIAFQESFYPLYDFRPRRFTGTRRPTLVNKDDRGSIFFNLTLSEPPAEPGSPACIPVSYLVDRAIGAGWQDVTRSAMFSTHGGPKSVMLTKGNRTFFPGLSTPNVVVSRAELESACFRGGQIDQKPTNPEPPLSAEERAAEERRSGLAAAAQNKARWRALPANGEEDRQARDARADFMADLSLRLSGLIKNPVPEAVAAMNVDELRAFAEAAASGSYWYTGRELCDAAVREADPVAALTRLTRARRLNPLEQELIHSYCFVYVEGRRYQHRQLPSAGASAIADKPE